MAINDFGGAVFKGGALAIAGGDLANVSDSGKAVVFVRPSVTCEQLANKERDSAYGSIR